MYILCVWSARLLLCSFVAVVAFRREHNTKYCNKKQIKSIWKYRKLLHNIEIVYNLSASQSGNTRKQKKTKKGQEIHTKKKTKAIQSGQKEIDTAPPRRENGWMKRKQGNTKIVHLRSVLFSVPPTRVKYVWGCGGRVVMHTVYNGCI